MLGLPHEDHLALLRDSSLMPLRELMAVDHDSALYNEGSRRGLFYAESWALMHYLSLGSPARSGQLREYLQQVKNGAGPEPAFKAAFGSDVDSLERELRDYARQYKFPGLRVTFNEKVNGSGAGRGDAITEMEANAYLGELLVVMGRVEDARTRLKAVIARNPASARGIAALGMLELQDDRLDAALPLLEQAAALDPANAATHRAWGAALYANSVTHRDDDAAAARAKARPVLSRAIELLPGDAELLVMLGHLESASDAHARATVLFERAVSIAPSRERYRLMLADSLVRQEDYARTTSYLGPLLAGGDPEIRETARDLLAFVAAQRGRAAAPAAAMNEPSRTGAPTASASSPRRRTEVGGRFVPEFRPLGGGERRVLGMFTGGRLPARIDRAGRRSRRGNRTDRRRRPREGDVPLLPANRARGRHLRSARPRAGVRHLRRRRRAEDPRRGRASDRHRAAARRLHAAVGQSLVGETPEDTPGRTGESCGPGDDRFPVDLMN